MGFSYRKKSGPFTVSASSKGMRVSTGGGCILPALFVIAVGIISILMLLWHPWWW